MLTSLLATLTVFASVGLMLYLISLLFNAASGPVGSFLERQRFARYVARARQCDELIKRGEAAEALREIHAAFYLRAVYSRSLASSVTNHHTALLSRLIAMTSDVQGGSVRLLSLAKTDRLLTERSELQRRLFNVRHGTSKERLRELESDLARNARDLEATLQKLIEEVAAARQPERFH